jgi:hypothetical protein
MQKNKTTAEEILAFIDAACRLPNNEKKELWVRWLVAQWDEHTPKFEIKPKSRQYLLSSLNKKKGGSNDMQKQNRQTIPQCVGQRTRSPETPTVSSLAATTQPSTVQKRTLEPSI